VAQNDALDEEITLAVISDDLIWRAKRRRTRI
jgi:hypothetical protein